MPSDYLIPAEVRLAEIVFPNHANHLGTLFGGQALAWMDKAAFLAGVRLAGGTVVTASSDRVDFHAPVRVGDLVEIVAIIAAIGRSSIAVDVELVRVNRDRTVCASGRFTMIAVDHTGRPRPIDVPPHRPEVVSA